MRFVLIILAVFVAVWLLRRALRGGTRAPEAAPPQAPPGQLVRCAHCGTHLPLAEARALGDRVYCSDEHARLGPGRS